jgi:hypothetical protein
VLRGAGCSDIFILNRSGGAGAGRAGAKFSAAIIARDTRRRAYIDFAVVTVTFVRAVGHTRLHGGAGARK